MNQELEKKIRITPLRNGTALDHLKPGTALKILGLLKTNGNKASIALNAESKRMGSKDLLFIEDRFLSKEELDKIALIACGGTFNLIKESAVYEKAEIALPEKVKGIIKCINPNCISNNDKIDSKFDITSKAPLKAKCFYCEAKMNEKEIANSVL